MVLRGLLVVLGLAVTLAGAGFAVLAAPARSAPEATCTAAEKAARTSAATAYRKRIAAERRAYFRKVADAKRRAAFVKRQRAKLGRLSAAAGCTVLTLPRSSGASCDFMLEPNAQAALLEGSFGSPFVNEGPLSADGLLPSRGRLEAVMIFVDFPDAPASEPAEALGSTYTSYLDWFPDVSYNRFSVAVTKVPTWFRMPQPARSYGSLFVTENLHRYVTDTVAAADAAVDFSRYQSVWIVPARDSGQVANTAYSRFPGRGVQADGAEIRFAMIVNDFRFPGTFPSTVANHEFLHNLGLADLAGGDERKRLGVWDPMHGDAQRGASSNHLIAWHKWLLGWLDPPQVTCLLEAGQLEETVTPIERTGGKKMIVVPVTPSRAYVLEVRRRIGRDRSICKDGVLLYTVDSQVRNGDGPVEGKSSGTTCAPDATPFAVGESYEDALIMLNVLASDGSSYRVRVTRK